MPCNHMHRYTFNVIFYHELLTCPFISHVISLGRLYSYSFIHMPMPCNHIHLSDDLGEIIFYAHMFMHLTCTSIHISLVPFSHVRGLGLGFRVWGIGFKV